MNANSTYALRSRGGSGDKLNRNSVTDDTRGRPRTNESSSRRSRSAHSYIKNVMPDPIQKTENSSFKGLNDHFSNGVNTGLNTNNNNAISSYKKKKSSIFPSVTLHGPLKASHDVAVKELSPQYKERFLLSKTEKRAQSVNLTNEMEKVVCQSYLLDEDQYELLHENKNILSNIEKKFQVKCSLSNVGEIPIVYQVNPLTNISCVVKSDLLENVPVDFLITDHLESHKLTSGFSKWESSSRRMELIGKDKKYWKQYFEESLNKAFNNYFPPPVTVGIYILHSSCIKKVLDVLQELQEKSIISSACYFILIVCTMEIKMKVDYILKSRLQEDLSDLWVPKLFAVKVVQGNLADQQVDVIVNSSNKYLNLKDGKISQSLLMKAGDELQKECLKEYPDGITYPEFAVTLGYNLLCKYVIHGALPIDSKDMVIKEYILNCLQFTHKNQLASIAFPALGTGNLNYSVSHVVQQMNEAFKDFEMNYLETSIQEIRIVLYTIDKELDLFYDLDNSRSDFSETGVRPSKTNPIESINWVQFVNHSHIKENLQLAIDAFVEQLKQHSLSSVKIPLEEFEDVFFFKDLHSVIPDIVQQLKNKKENFYRLHLSAETKDKLKALMLEVKQNIVQEQLNIIQPVSSTILDHCLLKARQVYPQVKYIVTNNGQNVIIQSLDWSLTNEAKYFLEIWLGIKSPLSVTEDRFKQLNSSKQINGPASLSSPAVTQSESSKSDQDASQPAASSTQESAKSKVFTQNSQINQDICCFQTENGLLVKVYQGDILNVDVDGIVNAANRWLKHSGGVAREIIIAAGDDVNREGQFKLGGKPLNDGDVLSTLAGNLKQYKYIIHAVGPIYSLTKNDQYCYQKIVMAVKNALEEAKNLNLQSLALPAISSAIFGVPMNICVNGYYAGILLFCRNHPNSCLKEVHFVDMDGVSVKEIQDFFKSHLIFIDEKSNSPSNRKSPKHLHRSLSTLETRPSSSSSSSSSTKVCLICLEDIKRPITLKKCNHTFCNDCIRKAFDYKPKCPYCNVFYGIETGNQPPGTMTVVVMKFPLSGYQNTDTYFIKYELINPFNKINENRNAFLPVTKEGNVVLKMLQLAFERRLIFTVGESLTTGAQNAITWNDIHHKTSLKNGQSEFAYPDPTYLQRVTEELASHGITPADVVDRKIKDVVKTT